MQVQAFSVSIEPDRARLVARPFLPGALAFGLDPGRLDGIVDRIRALPAEEQRRLLDEVRGRSADRYADLETTWRHHFDLAMRLVPALDQLDDPEMALLIGAFLTQGYAYESAALTNPSMVPMGAPDGGVQRFVMSARAIGEGHVSSIAFFTGSIDSRGEITLDPRSENVSNGRRLFPAVERSHFATLLSELNLPGELTGRVIDALGPQFSTEDLDRVLEELAETDLEGVDAIESIRRVHWLASSNYRISFDRRLPISEHLLSPGTPVESHGMEDARFVRFTEDDGAVTYYATYTAFDGSRILPQLIETSDFHQFTVGTLTGPTLHHKGMALFPRRIGGEYLSLSRHDHEQSFIMRSDDIHTWSNAEVLFRPERTWELVQTGNCGSPIETEAGWLVITHGVGAMRRYVLGALLLDLDEPAKVVARLDRPLLEPRGEDRGGYVPDVVYSCGSMAHNGFLVLPYGYSDYGIRVSVTPIDDLIQQMV